ncbi:cytochrome c oxidase cbb3-type subunit 3 [Albidovulum inexpectatum]|uniref:Cbb3-type cytochrome c oxidase subunit n=1 Tax=Albidovulum inexpectatum TaxID=196587 RepID=A0A2S5JL55_9RHOB|nr:cytochrome-c oxidase, cbb3-type subunit III [Albidovulum inexpectatum]PPB82180.1 cytochrome c oxidase cbb3-type subunit 3 [Albidovulum inexpectatum]
MSRKPTKTTKPPVETTGHSWDGIEEYNNPLPRWWLWTFYATIIWGVIYTIAYPAWPLINGATQGLLGHDTRLEVAEEIRQFEERNAPIEARLVSVDLNEIANDPELVNYTQNAGGAIFRTWCAQCHGSGAAGNKGYPNLLDNDWLWGGTIEDIHYTISHGIRNEEDPDARYSEMPRFGADGLLEKEQIDQVVQYVLKISGQAHDAAMAAEGEVIFADNCAACHGEDGTGDRTQGAPNLTDAIWLYGGDVDTLTQTVTYSRFGVMPPMGGAELSEAEIRAVAAWVHSRGGGE